MDSLLAKLSAQQAVLEEQKNSVRGSDAEGPPNRDSPEANTIPRSLANQGIQAKQALGAKDAVLQRPNDPNEVELLKQELNAAKDRILKQEKELTKSRNIHNVLDQPAPAPVPKVENISKNTASSQEAFYVTRPVGVYVHDDAKSDISEPLSAGGSFNRGASIWDSQLNASNACGNLSLGSNIWAQGSKAPWMNRPAAPTLPPLMVPSQHPMRAYSGSSSPIYGNIPQYFGDLNQFQYGNGPRRYNNQSNRSGSSYNSARTVGWGSYGASGEISPATSISPVSYQPMGLFQAPQGYQPRPIGTPLSPTAAEFTTANGSGPWNATVE